MRRCFSGINCYSLSWSAIDLCCIAVGGSIGVVTVVIGGGGVSSAIIVVGIVGLTVKSTPHRGCSGSIGHVGCNSIL